MPRYRVSGLPPQANRGLSAFFPNLTRLAASGAQQYKDGVTGRPGQPGIPIEIQATATPDLTAMAQKGQSSSHDAPWMIWPNMYFALPDVNYRPGLLIQMYDPVAPELTTMIPVPAVSGRQQRLAHSAALSAGITSGGSSRRQIPLIPRGLSKWKGRRSGNGVTNG